MSVDDLAARISAAMREVSNVVIESPDLKTKEERLDQEIGSPPGFNYVRERDENSLHVKFGGAVLCENAHHIGQLDEVIEKKRKIFPELRATTIHLTMINFKTFPFEKIVQLVEGIHYEKLHVTMRGSEADPQLLDFIRNHNEKEICLSLEDSLLDVPTLLSLPRLSQIDAYWLSGFRGVWAEENSLSERDFVDLVKIGHASVLLPVNIIDEKVLVEIVQAVSMSATTQQVILRIRPPLRDRFNALLGLKCTVEGDWEVDETTGFSLTDHEAKNSLRFGNTSVKMRWALTRKSYGPGSMEFYFVFIEREL